MEILRGFRRAPSGLLLGSGGAPQGASTFLIENFQASGVGSEWAPGGLLVGSSHFAWKFSVFTAGFAEIFRAGSEPAFLTGNFRHQGFWRCSAGGVWGSE